MDFLESRREAAERLLRYAAGLGTDLTAYRDEHDVFFHGRRWIDFWLDGSAVGYHLRGEVGGPPRHLAAAATSFRGVWDEAGSLADLGRALDLVRCWLVDAKEVDELTDRAVYRSTM